MDKLELRNKAVYIRKLDIWQSLYYKIVGIVGPIQSIELYDEEHPISNYFEKPFRWIKDLNMQTN